MSGDAGCGILQQRNERQEKNLDDLARKIIEYGFVQISRWIMEMGSDLQRAHQVINWT